MKRHGAYVAATATLQAQTSTLASGTNFGTSEEYLGMHASEGSIRFQLQQWMNIFF